MIHVDPDNLHSNQERLRLAISARHTSQQLEVIYEIQRLKDMRCINQIKLLARFHLAHKTVRCAARHTLKVLLKHQYRWSGALSFVNLSGLSEALSIAKL